VAALFALTLYPAAIGQVERLYIDIYIYIYIYIYISIYITLYIYICILYVCHSAKRFFIVSPASAALNSPPSLFPRAKPAVFSERALRDSLIPGMLRDAAHRIPKFRQNYSFTWPAQAAKALSRVNRRRTASDTFRSLFIRPARRLCFRRDI